MPCMKPVLTIVLTAAIAVTMTSPSFGQNDVDQLLTESFNDGRKLVNAYATPFMNSVSLGLNQGWYNTAQTHKVAGVDLTITASAMTIPKSDLLFDVTKLGLEVIELKGTSPHYPYAPTILGPDDAPVFTFTDSQTGITQEYKGPGGFNLEKELGRNWVPVPMANLGFGLPKGTDIKLRFTPAIDVGGDASLKIYGVGVMHDVKQWIPGMKLLPFDLSGFVGYTKFKMESYFDKAAYPDRRGLFEMNATTVQGLISKKFSVLTLYGGLGYNIARSTLAMKGTYDINGDGQVGANEIDPLDLNFSASGFRTTAGMRLKLAVLTFHADYTLQKYKCLTVGFGISVR